MSIIFQFSCILHLCSNLPLITDGTTIKMISKTVFNVGLLKYKKKHFVKSGLTLPNLPNMIICF